MHWLDAILNGHLLLAQVELAIGNRTYVLINSDPVDALWLKFLNSLAGTPSFMITSLPIIDHLNFLMALSLILLLFPTITGQLDLDNLSRQERLQACMLQSVQAMRLQKSSSSLFSWERGKQSHWQVHLTAFWSRARAKGTIEEKGQGLEERRDWLE